MKKKAKSMIVSLIQAATIIMKMETQMNLLIGMIDYSIRVGMILMLKMNWNLNHQIQKMKMILENYYVKCGTLAMIVTVTATVTEKIFLRF